MRNAALYVPIPGLFKFKKLYDEDEYLQLSLDPDPRTVSVFYIEEEVDLKELMEYLKERKINCRIKL